MNKPAPQELFSSLAPRQKEVLHLFCQGTVYKEIAELLVISENTVKSHMGKVYEKLDLLHLKRDDRIFKIRTIYCPMFENESDEIPETAIEVIDPEPEPEPVTPEVEEMLMSDQSAMIALYTSNQVIRVPSSKRRISKRKVACGCFSVTGAMFLMILMIIGGIVAWEYVQKYLDQEGISISIPSNPIISSNPSGPANTPKPAYTSKPADTPMPEDTPIPALPAIPALPSTNATELGDWYKEGDIWMRLADYEVTNGLIRLDFEIWNQTNQDIYFSWSPEQNFSMVDNKNNRYEVFTASTRQVAVGANERLVFFGHGYSTVQFEDDPLYNPGVTDIFVTMEYLSTIEKATFHIAISN